MVLSVHTASGATSLSSQRLPIWPSSGQSSCPCRPAASSLPEGPIHVLLTAPYLTNLIASLVFFYSSIPKLHVIRTSPPLPIDSVLLRVLQRSRTNIRRDFYKELVPTVMKAEKSKPKRTDGIIPMRGRV